MRVNIIGWYNKKNCGDESFKVFFDDIFKGHDIVYTTQNIEENCDYYVLGGGDVVKEYYLSQIPKEKPLICIGVGLGYESESEFLLNRNIKSLNVRNREDVEVFKKIGIEANYTPDIVFNLNKPIEIKKKLEVNKKKLSVILTDHVNPSVANKNVKELMYNEYFKWELAESLDYLAQFYQIYFVSLSDYYYANDKKMCLDIQSRMNHGYKTEVFEESENPNNLMDFLQQMDINVSMKFHGLIFSTIINKPFINIGLSRKTNKFCQEMGLSELSFDPKTFTKDNFLTKIKHIELNYKDIQNSLNIIDTKNKELLKINIEKWTQIIR